MRTGLTIILLVGLRFLGAQSPYGNEWIDWNNPNPYLKVMVVSEGIYRVDRSAMIIGLVGSGQGIGNVNPEKLQVFHNGEEQYIYFHDLGSPTSFDNGEYIEFYATKNDGSFDTDLYADPMHQANPSYSIASDSAAYFITWNPNAVSPRRLTALNNDLTNLPPVETWYMHRYQLEQHGAYWVGTVSYVPTEYLNDSRYDDGEGYAGGAATPGNPLTLSVNLNNIATGSPVTEASFRVRVVSQYPVTHNPTLKLNGTAVWSASYYNGKTSLVSFDEPVGDLVNGINELRLECGGSAITYQSSISTIEVLYPHTWDFSQNAMQWFSLEGAPGTDKYVEISNFFHQNQPAIIYDMTNHRRMIVNVSSGLLKAKIPMLSADSLALFITTQGSGFGGYLQPKLVTFTNFNDPANQGDYFIITHPLFRQPVNGTDYVEEYRKLRDNSGLNTGTYKARTVLIGQLYDQFAYGIPYHPKAIRNFVRFGIHEFSDTLKHVFIVGKGYNNVAIRNNPTLQAQSYINTFGYGGGPGGVSYTSADNLFPCEGHDWYPLCGIGRLSATSPDHVRIYYEKMKAQEDERTLPYTIDNKDWMKQVLHLGGGTTANEQSSFRSALEYWESLIEDTCFGGNVRAFYKTKPEPDQVPGLFDTLINEGVALITFYGHSSPGLLEFNLNDPADYENLGRMPVIIANGCLSGLICGPSPGMSEDYVLEEDRGAIAFVATSSFGLPSALRPMTEAFYHQVASKHYNEPLGTQLMHAYRDRHAIGASTYEQMLFGQQALHGDPGYSFAMHPKPDYAIDASSVEFVPDQITTSLGFFDVHVAVRNIGKAVKGDINVRISRRLPSGTTEINLVTIKAPHYLDTAIIPFPVDVVTSPGPNVFEIVVDVDPDSIDEIVDAFEPGDNNTIPPLTRFIGSSAAFPIFPYNYSIVGDPQLHLSASTIDPFTPVKTYAIEIDTTKLFNSPAKAGTQITQGGGVITWSNPPITLTDSTVYYWRITGDSVWHSSSFMYLPGTETGWNQSDFWQFTENSFQILELDSVTKQFEFTEDFSTIHINWGYVPYAISDYQACAWYINGQVHHKYGCTSGIILAVFDPKTGAPWNAKDTAYDWINNACDPTVSFNRQHAFNLSTTSPTARQHVKDVLDSIPDSMYVMILSLQNPAYGAWDGDGLFDKLYELGADSVMLGGIDTLPYVVPFAFFTQKGNLFKAVTHVGDTITSVLSEDFFIDGVWDRGSMYSQEVGPAYQWDELKFDWHALEGVSADHIHLDVYGKSNNGVQTVQPILADVDTNTDISWISPQQYPFLHVRVYCEDTVYRTPPQLDFWRVLYQPSPDAAVNPQLAFHFKDTTLAEGDTLEFEVGIENVTEYDMDSLLVQYTVYRSSTKKSDTVYTVRYKPLLAGESLITEHSFSTLSYPGFNILTMEANPGFDQPERHHFNNFAQLGFMVEVDKENPLLDVTFDGYHIMDGDIVSAKPEILIRLKDENMFRALDDSSLLEIYLKDPDGNLQQMVPDGQNVIFIPPDPGDLNKNNTARVLMYPLLPDGIYELIVQGRDKSGNTSADLDYSVRFEVINKPMLSRVLNYPNPFTTSTRFVFTLTGSEVPDFMKVQIMTVTGKVVREITGDELGNLHVGTNISEYAWDGRDQYGDPLANGVYLYRAVAYFSGQKEPIDLYQIDALDRYFVNDYGKMYLAR